MRINPVNFKNFQLASVVSRLSLVAALSLLLVMAFAAPALAADINLQPDCNPTLAPDQPGACNISAFTVWVQKIIKFLFWISMPLALIFGVYGGFVIITAGGAEERFKHGKNILTAAIVGLLIVFLSNLIVSSIVKILTKGEL